MVRLTFDNELEKLHNDLIHMCALVEKAIDDSISAFFAEDIELATQVIESDRTINDMEKVIEARALSIMLKQQPVASDLRNVSTALKAVTDLERIGDQAADISEILLCSGKEMPKIEHIRQMSKLAKRMVAEAVKAFIEQNLELADEIINTDDELDSLFNSVKYDIADALKEQPDNTDAWIDLLMVSKYLERIGDHAVNICEWTQFCITGKLKNKKLL